MKLLASVLLGATLAAASGTDNRRGAAIGLGDGLDVSGSAGSDVVAVAGDDNNVDGGDGSDVVVADGDNNTVEGGDGDDVIAVGGDDNTVEGGEGDDIIAVGGDGNEVNGGDGDDLIVGGDGDNTLNGDEGDDTIVAGDGDDTLAGGDGNDRVIGGAGDDVIIDGDGNDRNVGNEGDDVFVDGAGNDRYRGGRGSDKYFFELKKHKGTNRVFNFQHGETANYQDELHLLGVTADEVELSFKEVPVCVTVVKYTDPESGKKRKVRVHSRQGCLDYDDIIFDEPEVESSLPNYTLIPETQCLGANDFINTEAADPSLWGTPSNPTGSLNSTPLRFLTRGTREETAEACATLCSANDSCMAFNIVHTGTHSDGFLGTRASDEETATCYFRTRIDSNKVSGNINRDCYRVVDDITLVSQESRTTCIEGINYGYTVDYSKFFVNDGCRGYFRIGDSETLLHAESWKFAYAEYTF